MSTDSAMLHHAMEIAHEAHKFVDRKYLGVPYIAHPLSVMQRVRKLTDDPIDLAAAILHDTLEDCLTGDQEYFEGCIIDKCGREVLGLVEELTDHWTKENFPDMNRSMRKRREAVDWGYKSNRAKTIKCCDLIDNTESIVQHDKEFAETYMVEKVYMLKYLKGANNVAHSEAIVLANNYFRQNPKLLNNVGLSYDMPGT